LKNSTTRAQTPVWRQQLHYRLKEGALIALGAICLYLWMALLTYDSSDPGWTHTSNVEQVQNAAGRLGAWFADILFMALGYFAYVFPLLLAFKTLQVFRHRHEPIDWSGWLFSWRLIGLVFLVLSGSALADIHSRTRSGCRPRRVAPWARASAIWRSTHSTCRAAPCCSSRFSYSALRCSPTCPGSRSWT
jgi:S-DNA-T family DNA segregation ATPase FtsK/SpoIIIE